MRFDESIDFVYSCTTVDNVLLILNPSTRILLTVIFIITVLCLRIETVYVRKKYVS